MKARLNSNSIITQTQKAVLIKLPKKNEAFWHPTRFCSQSGKNDYILDIWFGENFTTDTIKTNTKTKQVAQQNVKLDQILDGYLI